MIMNLRSKILIVLSARKLFTIFFLLSSLTFSLNLKSQTEVLSYECQSIERKVIEWSNSLRDTYIQEKNGKFLKNYADKSLENGCLSISLYIAESFLWANQPDTLEITKNLIFKSLII